LSGFILLIVGFLGLLITEFILDGGGVDSPNLTLLFGALETVGFVNLAYARWGMKQPLPRINDRGKPALTASIYS